jgi:GNAT superfamily N-acetyltransferase
MASTEVEAVVRIYSDVIDPSYISFSELSEGKAETVSRLSSNAPDIFREQLKSLLHSPQHAFFVAAVDDELVGFALASLHRAEAGHTECWLDDIGVTHEWRRRGIAKALTSEVFSWGAEGKAAYYLLESGARKESAHHFFESLGFQPLSIVFFARGRE